MVFVALRSTAFISEQFLIV